MKIFIIFVLVLLLVSLLIFFYSSVYIRVIFKKNKLNKKSEVWIKYLFLKKKIYPPKAKKKKDKPKKPKEPEKEDNGLEYYKKKSEDAIYIFNALKEDLSLLLKFAKEKFIVIENFKFKFKFGLDDPMETGIATGVINGVFYTILGYFHNNIKIENCEVDISPDFDNVCHNISADCILRLKNVHITVIIVKIVRLYYKFKKVAKERK